MNFLQTLFQEWSHYVPNWLLGLALTAVGWVIAIAVRFVVTLLLQWMRFDALSQKTGLASFLRKGQVSFTPSQLFGIAAFWIVLMSTFFIVAILLDVEVATKLMEKLLHFIPSVVSALFVIVVGWSLVVFLSNFTRTIARNASWEHASTIAAVVKVFGGILIIAVAAEQIDLRITILSSLVLILVAGAALGLALAFGLGCQEMAREALKKYLKSLKEKNQAGNGPDLEG
ncbi:MAG: hypothetical protein HKM05_04570 [Spirochaetales bacterium]|nr:hypothetical protein [Spirochaetales bacterium]